MDITANTRERLNSLLELLLQRIKSLTAKPQPSGHPGPKTPETPELKLHELPGDRGRVFRVLGENNPQLAGELTMAIYFTDKKIVYRNLLLSLMTHAKEWKTDDKHAAYRMVTGLWRYHNEETKAEIVAMLLQRNSHEHMHDFLKFIDETNHPLYHFIKNLLPRPLI